MKVVNDGTGEFFLDASGGTGKTFLIFLAFLATIRSQNGIALALALSGIGATLLDGGRTAHFALKLLLNMQMNEILTCNFLRNSATAKYCSRATVECSMAHKKHTQIFGSIRPHVAKLTEEQKPVW